MGSGLHHSRSSEVNFIKLLATAQRRLRHAYYFPLHRPLRCEIQKQADLGVFALALCKWSNQHAACVLTCNRYRFMFGTFKGANDTCQGIRPAADCHHLLVSTYKNKMRLGAAYETMDFIHPSLNN